MNICTSIFALFYSLAAFEMSFCLIFIPFSKSQRFFYLLSSFEVAVKCSFLSVFLLLSSFLTCVLGLNHDVRVTFPVERGEPCD